MKSQDIRAMKILSLKRIRLEGAILIHMKIPRMPTATDIDEETTMHTSMAST